MTDDATARPTLELAAPTAGAMSLYAINRSIRRCIVAGFTCIGIYFGGIGTWAALAPLSSAVVVPGVVIVHGHRKTVQHLEGGIIRNILVHEGDAVRAGQVLLRLDDTVARATLDLLRGRYAAALAEQARLEAERTGAPSVPVPEALAERIDDPKVRALLEGQRQIFAARRTSLNGQVSILDQQIGQYKEEIAGLRAQLGSSDEQLRLIEEELTGVDTLYRKGMETKRRLLALKREKARLGGYHGAYVSRIAEAERNIGQKKLEKIQLRNKGQDDVVQQLRTVNETLLDLHERLRAAADVLSRAAIRAPQGGVVVDLKFHTAGGVIRPGQQILDIVPQHDKLVIESKIPPDSIASLHAGLRTAVRFTAYSSRKTPLIDGKLAQVSADRLTDPRTGAPYYMAHVNVDAESLKEHPEVKVEPGMSATVMIRTGSRTLLDYVIDPLTYSLRRALREK